MKQKNNMYNELGIEKFSYLQNTYERRGVTYTVTSLIEASKGLDVFDVPIKSIDIGVCPWGEVDIKSSAYHFIRTNEASLDYPIILDDTGYICDGWHRVVKAIIEGRKTIKAVRLTVMPEGVNNAQ